jgi:magnesium-transporting ATPase (P-type)
VNQALLTGEPYPAEKDRAKDLAASGDPVTATNAVFAGTSVVSGTAAVLVCRTGKHTALGWVVFAGYAVFLDPPKASAGATIKALRADGVTFETAHRRQRRGGMCSARSASR